MSQDAKEYVCAFRGRRDSYQAPLALAEAGLLDRFIADAYAMPWLKLLARYGPRTIRAKIASRSDSGIPVDRVHCLWGTTLLEHVRHRLGCSPLVTFNKLDRHFSRAAARRTAAARSHLFLYSPYAWEAFTARYPHIPRKILFQYHPHPVLERRLLAADAALHPKFADPSIGAAATVLPEALLQRERDCWKHADLILCASAFTKRSLLEAGANEKLCRIIPYGIEVSLPWEGRGEGESDAFHAVFVGTGGQRKGLHHLLLAWQQAALPPNSKLTLVCRSLDRELEPLIIATSRVDLRRGVSLGDLNAIYATSSLFMMPSLVEGFGQVYLEALAQGCPVLGTPNTCLPDLGGEDDGIFLVAPGNVEELTAKLETLSRILPGNFAIREAARVCAAKYTWPAFRQALRLALTTDEH